MTLFKVKLAKTGWFVVHLSDSSFSCLITVFDICACYRRIITKLLVLKKHDCCCEGISRTYCGLLIPPVMWLRKRVGGIQIFCLSFYILSAYSQMSAKLRFSLAGNYTNKKSWYFSFYFTKIEGVRTAGPANVGEADGSLDEHNSLLLNNCSVVEKYLSLLLLGFKILQTLEALFQ